MKFEFNPDGSLKIPNQKNQQKSACDELNLKIKNQPHYSVLKLIDELPFPVGRKLICAILMGKVTDQIKKLKLHMLLNYAGLAMYDDKDIYVLLEKMTNFGLIETIKAGSYLPVLSLTQIGNNELINPTIDLDNNTFNGINGQNNNGNNNISNNFAYNEILAKSTEISDKDQELFRALPFLEKYNDHQKKAIIDPSKKILCIAGAGSGKTTVLTKRIEFLVKFKSVPSEKILAITFTRKARIEMMNRLDKLLPNHNVKIETFNSFSEKILKIHGDEIYKKEFKVMNYSDKIKIVSSALVDLGYTVEQALDTYFTKRKLREHDQKTLFFGFINDIFGLMDHCNNMNQNYSELRSAINGIQSYSDKNTALFVFSLIKRVDENKQKLGLRDYSDQLMHTLQFFTKMPDKIPAYEHILVDEYQDVNKMQVKLLEKLNPQNLFVVGDPRQSIFGWRGSKVEFIMNFSKEHDECTIIQLTKNYRSTENIVCSANKVIEKMQLPNLESVNVSDKPITIISHPNEEAESIFIAQSILYQSIPRKDIFILARTNKQLEYISNFLQKNNIDFLKRTIEENQREKEPSVGQVTLSTVHAIKGLEAELVYLIGVNSQMFPCQASEHPVLDALKIQNSYDKYQEELRLLYVAMTRAKKQLVISYFNNISPFITPDLTNSCNAVGNGIQPLLCGTKSGNGWNNTSNNNNNNNSYNNKKNNCNNYKINNNNSNINNNALKKIDNIEKRLRSWRLTRSKELDLKPFMIFSDKTLFEIIEKRPTTFTELEMVNGIGPNKIQKFGEDILDVLHGLK